MLRFRAVLAYAVLSFGFASVPVLADKTEIKADTSQIETVAKFAKQAQKVADTGCPRIIKRLGTGAKKLPN